MDDATSATLKALGEEVDGLMDEVEAAYEEHASFNYRRQTRAKVDDASRRFRELTAGLDEKDREAIDRGVGRKVADLQKLASRLPAPPVGKPAEKLTDTGFFGTRAPKSSRPPVQPGLAPGERRVDRNRPRVGGEVEAWCGRCMMVRNHIIAALVGEQPAQVVCQRCGARSRFREGPPLPKKKETRAPVAAAPVAQDVKLRERNALLDELRAAENVRPFSPKERYKAGEIIEHPELGRGKIENTLPRSLLVRFASGLKPIKLG